MAKPTPLTSEGSMSTTGPYHPTAALPQRVIKKILELEFVEMAELTNDAWQDYLSPGPPNLMEIRTLFTQRHGQGVSKPSRHAMVLGSASTTPHLSNQQHSTWALPTSTRQSLGKTFTRNYPLAACRGHS